MPTDGASSFSPGNIPSFAPHPLRGFFLPEFHTHKGFLGFHGTFSGAAGLNL